MDAANPFTLEPPQEFPVALVGGTTEGALQTVPDRARDAAEFWIRLIAPLLAQGKKLRVRPAARALAKEHTLSAKTIVRKFYAAKKHGLRALLDLRRCGPPCWRTKAETKMAALKNAALLDLWRSLQEKHSRSSVTAHKELLSLWRSRDARIAAIPEYRDFPGWPALPRGWTYENLMRLGSSRFELAAARRGRFAAAAHRPTVFSTRVGLYPGSHYAFDDKWHDFFVNKLGGGHSQAGRPLEVYSQDLFSAIKLQWGVKVRERDAEGNYSGIGENMMRHVAAATLYVDGWSPRGTTLILEHGTAALSERIAKILHEISQGKIAVSESGMTGAAAHDAQYPGLVRGNPRHKAALESNNNLEHNRFDGLPGQTGRNVESRPEQLVGLLKHNAALLAAYDQLPPEIAARLEFPVLELGQFADLAIRIYGSIADDREHELEGWAQCGHVTQLYSIGAGVWLPLSRFDAKQRAALPAMIEAGLVQVKPVKMSRREVWDSGKRDLVKLPGWGVCAILGDDLAREITMRDNMFQIQDAEIGQGIWRYEPTVTTHDGKKVTLRDGEKYQAFCNPFAPDTLFLRDAAGRYLGESARIVAYTRGDVEAGKRAMGAAIKRESELLAPLQRRHAAEARAKAKRHAHNADVLAPDRPTGPSAMDILNAANAADFTDAD